ncbi:M24 family metallopeptidase [Vallitalea sp.]|jgi:Xaa-Pro aminopeptidase|uniref:M24 family metallopeptidase n=1 Tax=Vallitalea sp. TaxID=1882829 RepID=UPI0025CE7A36|nr:Xaa-Pro peptidase family protein [Vallitalea sp.]MCT4687081.1 Xaa-Pro peptidase family protein [Vallitalea sp.]
MRLQKLENSLDDLEIDAVLIRDNYNRRYLSGFTGSNAYIYISKNTKKLLTDFRYTEQANKQSPDFDIIDYTKSGLLEILNDIIDKDNAKTIGFEDETISYKEFVTYEKGLKNIELLPIGNTVEKIRMIKDEEELTCIEKAASIGDLAYEYILKFVKPGVTEKEVALEIETCMKKNGAENLSFDTIVASGLNSSKPHAEPSDKKIEEGDFVTLDFGCIYKGYCSDMTRTFVVGKASEKQKEIYNIVLEAQLKALEAIKAGCVGKDIDKVARDIITDKGYGEYFGHGLGHSVGLFIHEEPRFSYGDENVFTENMVVTVEPGIYVPGFGGVRIEDLVCVTKDGLINFVSSPKQLIELV